MRIVLVVLLSLLWGTALPAAPLVEGLPDPARQVLQAHRLPSSGLSVWVQDVHAGQPLVALNPDEPRNPASVMKLVTTLAGLEVLGPGYVWNTRVWAVGPPIAGGRLDGDLYLEGRGDPVLTTERFWNLLRGLRETGLEQVAGNLLVDGGHFDVGPADPGAFDGRPHRTYNVPPEALMIGFSATRFAFRPDRAAGEVVIMLDPPSDSLRIDNALTVSAGACGGAIYQLEVEVDHSGPEDWVRFGGSYPASCGAYSLSRAVSRPLPRVRGVFGALWASLGGRIDGGVRAGRVPQGARLLLDWPSPPLGEVIHGMNKHSNNVMTRQLLLTLGAEVHGPPGTLEKGRDAVGGWLRTRGIDAPGFYIDNGSGLSRDARISAATMGALLIGAYHSPFMPEYRASMSLAAIDGTMRRRHRGSALAGRMHMKTGLLNGVRAIAGYLLARSGRTYAVVVLHNHPGVHLGTGTAVQDALLEWLYEQ